jgi:hypothetical protein
MTLCPGSLAYSLWGFWSDPFWVFSGFVAVPLRSVVLSNEADWEAPFSVYKADRPATKLDQPFLLVFRTRHIVTLGITSDASSSAGYTGFSSIWPDAHHTITDVGGNDLPEQLHTVFIRHVTLGRL